MANTQSYDASSFQKIKAEFARMVGENPDVLNPWRGGQRALDLIPVVQMVYSNAASGLSLLGTLELLRTDIEHITNTLKNKNQSLKDVTEQEFKEAFYDMLRNQYIPFHLNQYFNTRHMNLGKDQRSHPNQLFSAPDSTEIKDTLQKDDLMSHYWLIFQDYRKKLLQSGNKALPLEEFLTLFSPATGYRIDFSSGYQELFEIEKETRRKKELPELSYPEFLKEAQNARLELAPYILRNNGDMIDLVMAKSYFNGQGVPCTSQQIMTGPGFKSLYGAALGSLMSEGAGSSLKYTGGTILFPEGYYQSLIAPVSTYGGKSRIVAPFTPDNLKTNLTPDVKAIVITNPSNPDGRVYSEAELKAFADVISKHNTDNPENPVYVISDIIYEGTVIDSSIPSKTANIVFAAPEMHKYTITITAPSKTFAFATSRIGILTTEIPNLLNRIKEVINMAGLYHTPKVERETTIAAFGLTHQYFIDRNNRYYTEAKRQAVQYLREINERFGAELLSFQGNPQGGWYLILNFNKKAIPLHLRPHLKDSLDLLNFLCYYGNAEAGTGILVFPGLATGYESKGTPRDKISARITLGTQAPTEEQSLAQLQETFRRIGNAVDILKTTSAEKLQAMVAKGTLRSEDLNPSSVAEKKVLMVGGGHLGKVVLKGLLAAGVKPGNIYIITRTESNHASLQDMGIQNLHTTGSIGTLPHFDSVIYAARPQDIESSLKPIYPRLVLSPPESFISIAYGTRIEDFRSFVPQHTTISRYKLSIAANEETAPVVAINETELSRNLFWRLGPIDSYSDEEVISKVEKVSKIGMAFYVIDALADAIANKNQISRLDAEQMVNTYLKNALAASDVTVSSDTLDVLNNRASSLRTMCGELGQALSDESLCSDVVRLFLNSWIASGIKLGISPEYSKRTVKGLFSAAVSMNTELCSERSQTSNVTLWEQICTKGGVTEAMCKAMDEENRINGLESRLEYALQKEAPAQDKTKTNFVSGIKRSHDGEAVNMDAKER